MLKGRMSGYLLVVPIREFDEKKGPLDFPGSPVVRSLHFHCRGHGVPSLVGGIKILHAAWHGQNKKRKEGCLGSMPEKLLLAPDISGAVSSGHRRYAAWHVTCAFGMYLCVCYI